MKKEEIFKNLKDYILSNTVAIFVSDLRVQKDDAKGSGLINLPFNAEETASINDCADKISTRLDEEIIGSFINESKEKKEFKINNGAENSKGLFDCIASFTREISKIFEEEKEDYWYITIANPEMENLVADGGSKYGFEFNELLRTNNNIKVSTSDFGLFLIGHPLLQKNKILVLIKPQSLGKQIHQFDLKLNVEDGTTKVFLDKAVKVNNTVRLIELT